MARAMPFLILGLLWASPEAMGQCYYTWQSIPNPPGWTCYAQAINDSGQVTGFTVNFGDNQRCFVWSSSQGTRLLPLPTGVTSMTGYDINDLGHVVGTMEVPTSGLGRVPFFWDGEQTHAIEMPLGAINGTAYALNNFDEVVGQFDTGSGVRPFLWRAGVFSNIGVNIPVTSIARDINELGEIIGEAVFPGYLPRAIKIVEGTAVYFPEPAGFIWTFAHRLNNNGLVVGTGKNAQNQWRGLVWNAGQLEVFDPPFPFDQSGLTPVNDAGQIVGAYSHNSIRVNVMIWPTGLRVELDSLLSPQIPVVIGAGPLNEYGQFTIQVNNGTAFVQPHWLLGDLTGDCEVGFDDLLFVLGNFGSPQGAFARGDVDRDGDVDLADLTMLLSSWGSE